MCKSSSHHTLLHRLRDGPTDKTTPKQPVSSQVLDSVCFDTITDSYSRLFTKTVPVWLSSNQAPNEEILTYALLDDHSNKTYITNNVLNRLGVDKEKATVFNSHNLIPIHFIRIISN